MIQLARGSPFRLGLSTARKMQFYPDAGTLREQRKESKIMSYTTLIILVVLGVLLFGGGGGYYWRRRR
jgi:LPXTG-motif cell wall-anchored protein